MNDAPGRAIRDLLQHLHGADVDLPDDLGDLASDEEGAAFLRAAASVVLPATRICRVEVDEIYEYPITLEAGASIEEFERAARAAHREFTTRAAEDPTVIAGHRVDRRVSVDVADPS